MHSLYIPKRDIPNVVYIPNIIFEEKDNHEFWTEGKVLLTVVNKQWNAMNLWRYKWKIWWKLSIFTVSSVFFGAFPNACLNAISKHDTVYTTDNR